MQMALETTEIGEITQNNGPRRSKSFKVTDIGTSGKHVCEFY